MKTLTILLINSLLGSQEVGADELSQFKFFSNEQEKSFDNFSLIEREKFRRNEEHIYKKWNEIAVSSKKVLVQYYDKNNVRLIVDYENGQINLDALGKNELEIKSILNDLISDSPMPDSILTLDELQDENSTKEEYLKTLIEKVNVDKGDPDIGTRSKLNFSMISGHIKIRAKRYVGIVKKWSQINNIEPELVMAMIRQESAFNPRAESHIPAYGLMQIVPKYAGLDVMRQLKGRDEKPSRDALFDPATNVMFGTSYIKILNEKLREFTNDKYKLEPLVIASYNWGPDRIIKAIKNKKLDLNKPELEEQIREIAPEETKDYLKKVIGHKKEFGFKE